MLINNIETLIPIIQDTNNKIFGIDVETNGLNPWNSLLLLIQLSTPTEQYVINYGKCDKKLLNYALEILKERNVLLIGHNIKFDLKFLYHNTGVLFTNVFDTQQAEVLAFLGIGNRYPSLSQLVKKYLHLVMEKDTRDEFIDKTDYEFTDEQISYAEMDVKVLHPLMDKLQTVLKDRGQYKVQDMEMALIPVVAKMEYDGVPFNSNEWLMLSKDAELGAVNALLKLNSYLSSNFDLYAGTYKNALDVLTNIRFPVKSKLKKAQKEFYKNIIVKDEIISSVVPLINFGSWVQAKYILNRLGVNIETTNAKELKLHEDDYPVIQYILAYRNAIKRTTSFGEDFLKYVNPITNCIHTKYNQMGAVTGRFSSDSPNLQNIISDPLYRKPFTAHDGYLLGATDYSNIELRIIGEASKEPEFITAFNNGLDLHRRTAAAVFGVPYEEVTKAQRKLAKSLNFAVVYGTTARGLAYNFNIPLEKSKELLKKYFDAYPKLAVFLRVFGQKCIEKGYTVTMAGRKRYLSFELNPAAQQQYKEYYHALRQGVNTLPQGTSADMIKQALIFMFYDNPFGMNNFRPLLTVHDEIVVEFKEDIKDEAVAFIGKCMKSAGELYLKLIPVEYSISVEKFWLKD